MTRSGRNLNIRILKSFLNDVAQGIFGETEVTPALVDKFFTYATDSDLLRLGMFMDRFTSNLESNPEPIKHKALKAFVDIVAS